MTEKMYHSIEEFFKKYKFLYKLLKLSYKALPALVFATYFLFLIISAFIYSVTSIEYFKIVLVPLGVFIAVSVFRKLFNFQRPYEKLNITPIIHKDKKGHSFPSRHTASAVIIAMAFLYANTVLGTVFLVISVLIALTRVLAGVHFIRDVVAGGLFSAIIGLIFLFLI